MMGRVELPGSVEHRKRLYSLMLELLVKNSLSEDELILLCKSRGYVCEKVLE